MRGLKPQYHENLLDLHQSHLLQMRGLKLLADNLKGRTNRRIFYRCVDWNFLKLLTGEEMISRIFYRCVDWNQVPRNQIYTLWCRIFYRCVDWNDANPAPNPHKSVASFTDAWIETIKAFPNLLIQESHLLQMRGLKLSVRLVRIY